MPGELAAALDVGCLGAPTFSLELQLDAATSAAIDRTNAVRARRAGVKKFLCVRGCSLALVDIKFFLSDQLLPNLKDSKITGASPFSPISSTPDNSDANPVASRVITAPVFSPWPRGMKITRPQ